MQHLSFDAWVEQLVLEHQQGRFWVRGVKHWHQRSMYIAGLNGIGSSKAWVDLAELFFELEAVDESEFEVVLCTIRTDKRGIDATHILHRLPGLMQTPVPRIRAEAVALMLTNDVKVDQATYLLLMDDLMFDQCGAPEVYAACLSKHRAGNDEAVRIGFANGAFGTLCEDGVLDGINLHITELAATMASTDGGCEVLVKHGFVSKLNRLMRLGTLAYPHKTHQNVVRCLSSIRQHQPAALDRENLERADRFAITYPETNQSCKRIKN